MFEDKTLTRVLLPVWIWEEARNEDELKLLILDYMKKYPNYTIKSVKDHFAICERRN